MSIWLAVAGVGLFWLVLAHLRSPLGLFWLVLFFLGCFGSFLVVAYFSIGQCKIGSYILIAVFVIA